MKVLLSLAAAVAVVALQDRPEPRPCDVANIQTRDWCPTCGVFVEPAEVDRARHEVCDTRIEPAKACVRTGFPCDQHGARRVWHARRCCPINRTDCCQLTTVLAKIEYRCDTCLKRGRTPDDIVHTNTRHSGPIVTTCSRSGAYPHGGESVPALGEQRTPTRLRE